MSAKDKPKAAKFQKIESFFNEPVVAVTDANDLRSLYKQPMIDHAIFCSSFKIRA